MRIKVNGMEMSYELSGRGGAPAVVLSHSLGSSLIMWQPQMEPLEAHFRVLRYDIRGHGESEAPDEPYTLELLGDDVIGLLDGLGIDKVHFVGLSLGGMIGQCLALNHGHRLMSLVLCDTAAIVPSEAQPVWEERFGVAREKGLKALVEQTMERWFTPAFLNQHPPGLSPIRNQFLATSVAGFVGCGQAIRKLNYLDRLTEIRIPTLIIVGEDDPGTPVAAAEVMQKRIPNSKLVVLPSARHLSNVEQPQAFNAALTGFLKNV